MLTQDYLVRIMVQFAEIIRRSWMRATKERDPRGAADMLEDAVGEATDIDGGVLLSLSPESIASVMQVSGTDPKVTEYIARSLLLASGYLCEAGDYGLATVREQQARAIAEAYGHELPETPEGLAGLLDDLDEGVVEQAEPSLATMGFDEEPFGSDTPVVSEEPRSPTA
ncbi:MAG: hypothetical protein RSG23_09175 [Gordonibacter sp.]|uniref:hypothetical protein n=1 Tax=Gordonibacter sp. TaxID=1968902 RepID=UPI002FC7167D